MTSPILSLCLPTNGIVEWVLPVLDSIYDSDVDRGRFEVVVTDNGISDVLEREIESYCKKYQNLVYRRTNARLFDNQLEALKLAKGEYFKLVNHRFVFLEGALQGMIEYLQSVKEVKPVIYFSNGVLKQRKQCIECQGFDGFVKTLRRYASWTTGVGIWKEQYDKLPDEFTYDEISPHSAILFSERKADSYIINDLPFCAEIEAGHKRKGKYDLFRAFGVEEVFITQKLLMDGDITPQTFKLVKRDYGRFVGELCFRFLVMKEPCSYDLSGFNDALGVYFRRGDIYRAAFFSAGKAVAKKILRK